jgi:hypothetical protein
LAGAAVRVAVLGLVAAIVSPTPAQAAVAGEEDAVAEWAEAVLVAAIALVTRVPVVVLGGVAAWAAVDLAEGSVPTAMILVIPLLAVLARVVLVAEADAADVVAGLAALEVRLLATQAPLADSVLVAEAVLAVPVAWVEATMPWLRRWLNSEPPCRAPTAPQRICSKRNWKLFAARDRKPKAISKPLTRTCASC